MAFDVRFTDYSELNLNKCCMLQLLLLLVSVRIQHLKCHSNAYDLYSVYEDDIKCFYRLIHTELRLRRREYEHGELIVSSPFETLAVESNDTHTTA